MKKAVKRARAKSPAKVAKARPVRPTAASQAAAVAIDPAFQPVAAAFAKDPEVGLGRMFSSNSVLNVNGKICVFRPS
jgi:hypothetical protein